MLFVTSPGGQKPPTGDTPPDDDDNPTPPIETFDPKSK